MNENVVKAETMISLVEEQGKVLGKTEKALVKEFAYYSDSYPPIEQLIVALSEQQHEYKYGIVNAKIVEPYRNEIELKKEFIKEFVTLQIDSKRLIDKTLSLLNQHEFKMKVARYEQRKIQNEVSQCNSRSVERQYDDKGGLRR